MELTKQFEAFTDTEMAMDAGAVVAGVLVGEAAIAVFDSGETMGFDLPGEAGGALAIYGAYKLPVDRSQQIQIGAWVALMLRLMARFGVRNKVREVIA